MRAVVLLSVLALAAFACRPSAMSESTLPTADLDVPTAGIAVVELFTSEGCSSCPPADAVLRDLAARADSTGETLIPLSFHVDYWDRLGWADPYSDPAYTARQRAYASADAFERRVYTPAMIVNGSGGFVGSQRATATAHVTDALASSPRVTLSLTARLADDRVTVTHRASDAPDGAVLHLALVEDGASQNVTRGENRGRRLAHARVVRAFDTVRLGTESTQLALPPDLPASGARVVGWVQDGEVGAVWGAAQVSL